MAECKIKPVESNAEKALSFKYNMAKYKIAVKNECYLEALWIIHSMIEDRTSAFLYYCGFITHSAKKGNIICKKFKQSIIRILQTEGCENKRFNFNKLYFKLEAICKILKWANECEPDNKYEKMLADKIRKVNKNNNLLTGVTYLDEEWRDKRNELTHALFNKNTEDAEKQLRNIVENGYDAMRDIDNSVKTLKSGKNIRFKLNIQ